MMEQKNLILAIGLSLIVLIGSQYLINRLYPPVHPVATTSATSETTAPGTVMAPAAPAAPSFKSREAALAESARVKISSDALLGSIALTGGRLDDLTLARYRETVQKDSPLVTLLNPVGTVDAYFADFGWGADADSKLSLPDKDTRWTADGTTLTPDHPVTITWNN